MDDAAERAPEMLRHQITDVLNFYYPRCIDHVHGGYILQLDEEYGHVYDAAPRHLVATSRMIFNFCVGSHIGGPDWCRSAADHGLRFLLTSFRDADRGGFHWLLDGRSPVERERHCYGHVFALLACSAGALVDLPGAFEATRDVADLLDRRFRDQGTPLFIDRCSPDWERRASRGQNANMHACEALLLAHEATGERTYLERACDIAETVVLELTRNTDGLIWEYYTPSWEPEWGQPSSGGGFEPGHQAEWAKLLCHLHDHRSEPWMLERAELLFDGAVTNGWDREYGGFVGSFDRDGTPVDTDKVRWPVTEGIGAAACLAQHDPSYWDWYDRFWAYAREHLINPKYGIWYRSLTRENERTDPGKGPCFEPGYHPVNNAWIALRSAQGGPAV